jgi:NAD(P)-dependent dehydrogenase (short-subunit alcohol dehydrogenase family)
MVIASFSLILITVDAANSGRLLAYKMAKAALNQRTITLAKEMK